MIKRLKDILKGIISYKYNGNDSLNTKVVHYTMNRYVLKYYFNGFWYTLEDVRESDYGGYEIGIVLFRIEEAQTFKDKFKTVEDILIYNLNLKPKLKDKQIIYNKEKREKETLIKEKLRKINGES